MTRPSPSSQSTAASDSVAMRVMCGLRTVPPALIASWIQSSTESVKPMGA